VIIIDWIGNDKTVNLNFFCLYQSEYLYNLISKKKTKKKTIVLFLYCSKQKQKKEMNDDNTHRKEIFNLQVTIYHDVFF
jgi:hypothetical protein